MVNKLVYREWSWVRFLLHLNFFSRQSANLKFVQSKDSEKELKIKYNLRYAALIGSKVSGQKNIGARPKKTI